MLGGGGGGKFLEIFSKMGFKKLYLVDINVNINDNSKINWTECSLDQYNPKLNNSNLKFDLIFLNHSLEHMDNQLDNMKHLNTLLKDNGEVILRIPIKNQAYQEYGVNWYQIDAPRHFFIHTLESFKILCDNAGFEIKETIFDSDFVQFVKSEEYKKDIAWYDKESYREKWRILFKKTNLKESIFNKEDIARFKRRAMEFNNENLGDQAIFLLKKLKKI